ncbi:hypothetical protein FD755_002328 [Muntiacus reevesi]|uniref:DENN domain-containing protein 5B n=1 Tax=Muntiacus reevesi TaxID=9886 RepID=A0A5J5N565_MUNRE|nr:hypothetical protein FD755_002328 [Muntiacus reevesi]
MSGSGAAPGPASGSSPAACRFAHYFVLCGIDADSGLEPDELAGKAGLRQRGTSDIYRLNFICVSVKHLGHSLSEQLFWT